ncbi:hypothetical protein ACF0H5_018145 [Mactra antiquata]
MHNICKLFRTDLPITKSSEFYVYRKTNIRHQNQQILYADCKADGADVTNSCQPTSCPQRHIHGAAMFGNSLLVGSVVKYQCTSVADSETSMCLPNGTWTPVHLACLCRANATFDFDVISSNSTHVTTERRCPDGTTLIQVVQPTCKIATGEWQYEDLGCCETGSSEWLKVFRLSAGYTKGILSTWRGEYGNGEYAFFMRSWKIRQWGFSMKPTRVKLEVYKNNEVVAFMEFSGCNTDRSNWLALNRLINSSWVSLNKNSTVDTVSVTGKSKNRFLVSQLFETTGDFCNLNSGWFVASNIMKHCPDSTSTELLYAPGDDPMLFKDMESADLFIVWLKV